MSYTFSWFTWLSCSTQIWLCNLISLFLSAPILSPKEPELEELEKYDSFLLRVGASGAFEMLEYAFFEYTKSESRADFNCLFGLYYFSERELEEDEDELEEEDD